ncbi:MAG: AAA family ATPase, partial [Actinomycetes bacterium]
VDGVWSRLDARAYFSESRTADALAHARLRATLTEAVGVVWGRVDERTGAAEIVGIDANECELASKRTAQIDELASVREGEQVAEKGRPLSRGERTALRQEVTLETRRGKDVHATAGVITGWQAGRDERTGTTRVQRWEELEQSWSREPSQSYEVWTPERVLAETLRSTGRATCTEAQIRRVCARTLSGRVEAEHIPARVEELAGRTVKVAVSLSPGHDAPSQARYTSEAMLATEVEALATVEAEHDRPVGGVGAVERLRVVYSRDASGRALDEEQKAAVAHLTSPGLHRALVAPAGAGKTFTIAQATRAWQVSGQHVVVLGQQANTAKITADEIGQATGTRPPEMTIAGFLGKGPVMSRDARGLREDLQAAATGAGAVILLDEAATIGNHDLAALIEYASEHNVALRTVGDPHQQGSIEAGGLWSTLAKQPNATAELSEVRRFTHAEEGEVSTRLRQGDASALEWYIDQGRIRVHADRESAIAAAAAEVSEAHQTGADALLITGTDVDRRAGAAAVDLLTVDPGDVRHYGEVAVAEGQMVRTRNNDRRLVDDHGQSVLNGATWRIEQATDDGLHVKRGGSDAHAFLPVEYVAKYVEPASAITVKRGQGATVDRAAIVGAENMDLRQFYVANTRARQGATLHVVAADLPEARDQLLAVMGRDNVQLSAVDVHAQHLDARYQRNQALRQIPWTKRDPQLKRLDDRQLAERKQQLETVISASTRLLPRLREQLEPQRSTVTQALAVEQETSEQALAVEQLAAEVAGKVDAVKRESVAQLDADLQELRDAQSEARAAGRLGRGKAERNVEQVRGQLARKYRDAGSPPVNGLTGEWQQRAFGDAQRSRLDGLDPAQLIEETKHDVDFARTRHREAAKIRQTEEGKLEKLEQDIEKTPGRVDKAQGELQRVTREVEIRDSKPGPELATDQGLREATLKADKQAEIKAAERVREASRAEHRPPPSYGQGRDGPSIGR